MSDHNELIAQAAEALTEIDVTADAARRAVVDHVREQTGAEIAFRPPSVMDASRGELIDADRRAQHACRAMEIVLRGWTWGDACTLGELMPELPQDVRELVADHLAEAGLS